MCIYRYCSSLFVIRHDCKCFKQFILRILHHLVDNPQCIMTGMIGSEVAGLRKKDIQGDVIQVVNLIVPRRKIKERMEKEALKNEYRYRTIPITIELRKRLEEVMIRNSVICTLLRKCYDSSDFSPITNSSGTYSIKCST